MSGHGPWPPNLAPAMLNHHAANWNITPRNKQSAVLYHLPLACSMSYASNGSRPCLAVCFLSCTVVSRRMRRDAIVTESCPFLLYISMSSYMYNNGALSFMLRFVKACALLLQAWCVTCYSGAMFIDVPAALMP
eukprot:scaffold311_cov19-Tisochrysis_lutea.AAC.1